MSTFEQTFADMVAISHVWADEDRAIRVRTSVFSSASVGTFNVEGLTSAKQTSVWGIVRQDSNLSDLVRVRGCRVTVTGANMGELTDVELADIISDSIAALIESL